MRVQGELASGKDAVTIATAFIESDLLSVGVAPLLLVLATGLFVLKI